MRREVLSPTPPVECLSMVKVWRGVASKVSPEKRMALGEGGELFGIQDRAEEDGHEEGGDLGVGDEEILGGAVDDGFDEGLDFGFGED